MVGVDRIVVGLYEPANLALARGHASSAEMDVQATNGVTGSEVANGTTANPDAVEVTFSEKAQQLSDAALLFQQSEAQSETDQERIKQVREAIENGAHRVQQVVLTVAARVATNLEGPSGSTAPTQTTE